jgi:arginine decarboxylase
MLKDAVELWSVTDAVEGYDVARWGKGYFGVNAQGHLTVHPTKDPAHAIDMKELIDRLQMRGLDLPILLRFNGILRDRLTASPTASGWKRAASRKCSPSSP